MENLDRAYRNGLLDGQAFRAMPSAQVIQEVLGITDEEVVCYLNGIGDGIAGFKPE